MRMTPDGSRRGPFDIKPVPDFPQRPKDQRKEWTDEEKKAHLKILPRGVKPPWEKLVAPPRPGGNGPEAPTPQLKSKDPVEPTPQPREQLTNWSKDQPATIQEAANFDQLYSVLDTMGTLQGSQQEYTADQLKTLIEAVRKDASNIKYITSSGGLRQTVLGLIQKATQER